MLLNSNVLHIVSHTHWDREWYLSNSSFQARLVYMLDNLIDILEKDPDYRNFQLDGQTIVLEDYLAIRPEKAAAIGRLVKSGRLHIGPWYTASDETLVSGESLVRNLLIGLHDCAAFGPASMVGYLPDQFGHIAQLPQILRGFGCESVVMGRGINRGRHKNEFTWIGADGSEVFGEYLNNWYSNARNIPADPEQAREYIAQAAEKVARFSTTSHLLLMNGVDHMEAQPTLSGTLHALAQTGDLELVHDSLAGAVAAIRAAVNGELEVFHGELREDQGGRLDAGTLSARMPLKLANFRTTQVLERLAEPLAALSMAIGGPDQTALVQTAWRKLLQNHPHDSICGCSIDEVAREMACRFQSVLDLGTTIADRAMQALAPALGYTADGESLIFNPAPVAKSGVQILTVDIPLAEPTRSPVAYRIDPERNQHQLQARVATADGTSVPAQLLNVQYTQRLVLAPLHLPRTQPVQRACIAVELPLPAFGINRITATLQPTNALPTAGLAASPRYMENEHLIVEVAPDDTLWITQKSNGRKLGPLHVIKDGGDAGDTYHYVAPQRDRVYTATRATSVQMVENGPLCAAICLRYELAVPEALSENRTERRSTTVPLIIETIVRLRRGSAIVTFDTEVRNAACDHRLQVLFPTGVLCDEVVSGSQFTAVRRPVALPADWVNAATARPQWGWTDAAADNCGTAVLAQGLTEIEPLAEPTGITLALTLLRCVGAVSRGTATPLVIPAPEAQCLGSTHFTYALHLHSGDWRSGCVAQEWEAFAAAPAVFQPRPSAETTGANAAPAERTEPFVPFVVDNPEFIISAIKTPTPVADGEVPFNLVIRGYSLAATPITVNLHFDQPPLQAYDLSLAEEVLRTLPVCDGTVTLQVQPMQLVTVGTCVALPAKEAAHA